MFQIGSILIPIDNPLVMAWWFFSTIGWIIPVFFFCWGMILTYQNWIRSEYRKSRRYIMLAIDVPKNSEQTMRAIENFFNHMHGAHQNLKWHHLWWKGEVKDTFSFELVSIGGNIQYIIHFVAWYRDLVEAAIYAQYSDAEITEIEDYTKRWNIKLPHEKYQLFGTELKLTHKQMYPIITYKEFEDSLSGELKDPLSALLEMMNRVGPGEELWLQYLVTPADNDWPKTIHAKEEVNKIIGAKSAPKKDFLHYFTLIPRFILEGLTPASADGVKKSGEDRPNNMLYLTEGEKGDITAIQGKTSKAGFHVRVRWIYVCPKEKYNTFKALHAVYGAFKQFNSLGSNGFKADSKYLTAAIVFFKKTRLNWRRNIMLTRYKNRGHFFTHPGEYGFILNSEEMASLWHFPTIGVKAPLIQKVESKKAEPPTTLPTVDEYGNHPATAKTLTQRKSSPPENLPT